MRGAATEVGKNYLVFFIYLLEDEKLED